MSILSSCSSPPCYRAIIGSGVDMELHLHPWFLLKRLYITPSVLLQPLHPLLLIVCSRDSRLFGFLSDTPLGHTPPSFQLGITTVERGHYLEGCSEW